MGRHDDGSAPGCDHDGAPARPPVSTTCWCGLKMIPRGPGVVGCPQHLDNIVAVGA